MPAAYTAAHRLPLDSLVELLPIDGEPDDPRCGLRLLVTAQTRDCDGSPLYCVGPWPGRHAFCGRSESDLRLIFAGPVRSAAWT